MTDNNTIIKKLRENNPFSSPASPLPWVNTNPDLQNLNRQTSDRIEQLIRKKRLEPSVPLAGLILGEAGSGKTHMLTRILRKLRNNAQLAVFTAVKAFHNPKSVTQNIFSEIFNSLKLPHSNGRSQFDVVISEFMNTYRERRHNDGFDSTEDLDLRTYIRKDIPELSRNFLKCIMLYMSAKDEGMKIDILEWLRDGLDDEDSLRLGLPSRSTESMNPSEREQDAANILSSLGHVLSYARVPLVLCFDQLDNMKDEPEARKLITAWGNSVALLMNDLPGIIPLCFVRAAIWNQVFVPVLDEAVEQRISSNNMQMYSCTVEQAKQLLRDRIKASFGNESEEIYGWLISRLNITQEYSPRQVIEIANRVINSSDNKQNDTDKTIIEAFYDEYKKVQAAPLAWPPNAEQLILSLEVWLSSLEGFTVQKTPGKYIKLQGLHGEKKFAFIITTAKGHSTVSAALKAGMAFMNEYPGSECFYISEDKTHKKTWKLANENLRKFVEQGGHSVILDEDSRVNWYALTALINRVDNGDVNIYSASSPHPATRSDISAFVRTLALIDSSALRFSPATVTYTPPSSKPNTKAKPETKIYFDDKLFSDTLSSLITSSPMKILAVEKAAELLSQRGIKASRNEIIAFVKNHSERFKTYSSKNDTLITLEGRN